MSEHVESLHPRLIASICPSSSFTPILSHSKTNPKRGMASLVSVLERPSLIYFKLSVHYIEMTLKYWGAPAFQAWSQPQSMGRRRDGTVDGALMGRAE